MRFGTRRLSSSERRELSAAIAHEPRDAHAPTDRTTAAALSLVPGILLGIGTALSVWGPGIHVGRVIGMSVAVGLASSVVMFSWLIRDAREARRESLERDAAMRSATELVTLTIDVRHAWTMYIEADWCWLLVESVDGQFALLSMDPDPALAFDSPRRTLELELLAPEQKFVCSLKWTGEALEEPEEIELTVDEKSAREREIEILAFDELPLGWREQIRPLPSASSARLNPLFEIASEPMIVEDDLSGPEIQALLSEHLRGMHANSPAGSVHALDLDALRQPGITFWSAWDGDELLGCGALQALDATHGEIKSMRTASAHLRRGVGSAMLGHIMDEAKRRGYRRLSLETGSGPAFEPAHAMYARRGFTRCGPFADYRADAFSVFMTTEL